MSAIKKSASQPVPQKSKRHFDGAGHLNPEEAARLLELSREGRSQDPEAFVGTSSTNDDLAEELAEAAVEAMTTGQDALEEDLEATVEEERGGPFTETSGNTEFAGGTDESNIEGATREPFPTANAGKLR
jgi:hypothetical protein